MAKEQLVSSAANVPGIQDATSQARNIFQFRAFSSKNREAPQRNIDAFPLTAALVSEIKALT